MCTALVSHGVNSAIIQWMKATLEGRLATATHSDTFLRVAVSRGCPQGDVLSLLLWCLVVDLIARLSVDGVYCQGYVDDICLLAVGKFLLELMQRVVHTAETWCGSIGLLVNPDETKIVLFTRKRKLSGFFERLHFGIILASFRVGQVSWSHLDSRLTWWEHLNIKVMKAQFLVGL
jgi:hypothetical protein